MVFKYNSLQIEIEMKLDLNGPKLTFFLFNCPLSGLPTCSNQCKCHKMSTFSLQLLNLYWSDSHPSIRTTGESSGVTRHPQLGEHHRVQLICWRALFLSAPFPFQTNFNEQSKNYNEAKNHEVRLKIIISNLK